jgi:hypothetical protein
MVVLEVYKSKKSLQENRIVTKLKQTLQVALLKLLCYFISTKPDKFSKGALKKRKKFNLLPSSIAKV